MGIFQQFPYSNFHEYNLDELIKIVKNLQVAWAEYQDQWSDLYDRTNQALIDFKTFAYNYFATLDLSEETEKALRRMIADGTINPVITNNLSSVVTDWLANNITITPGVVIDTSLSVEGAAADAKATGTVKNAVSNIMASYNKVNAVSGDNSAYALTAPYVLGSDGSRIQTTDALYQTTVPIPVNFGELVFFKYGRARYNNQVWAFYDANMNVIQHSNRATSGIWMLYNQMLPVPFGASYFCVAYDSHDLQPTEQTPNVYIITSYDRRIETDPHININIDPADITLETITGTKSTNHILSAQAFDLTIAGDPQIDFSTTVFDVTGVRFLKITNACTRYANLMFAFFDAVDQPLYMETRSDNLVHDYLIVEAPANAVKLIVSGYQTSPAAYKIIDIAIGSGSGDSWSGIKWACMGDSLTDENNMRATKRYFNYINEVTGINVVNLGKSGTGYMKDHNGELPFYQRVNTIPLDSNVITIFGSGNDCSLPLGTPTDNGTTTVCGCINTTIDGIRSRITGANLGIISPTPWDQYPTYTNNAMSAYCNALEQICNLKGVPFLNLYRCSNMCPWDAAFRAAFYSRDEGNGVHPDENGHRFFAPHIKAFLETLLL